MTNIVSGDFIKKSHEIVFSQLDLTPVEYDIFALMLRSLAYEVKEDFFAERGGQLVYNGKPLELVFNSDELQSWFNVRSGALKNVLYNPCDRLSTKKIGLSTENQFDFIPLFKRIKYDNGILTITPNDVLLPAYFGGSLGHARVSAKEFRRLKRDSSKKLYSILSRFKDSGSGKVGPKPLNELYGYFGMLNQKGELKKSQYERFSVFASRVIRPAIEEIESVDSNIRFYSDPDQLNYYGFKVIKRGRKIVKVEFLYSWQGESRRRVASRLSAVEQAKAIHEKIMNNDNVTNDELIVLKGCLTELVIEGVYICDLARLKLQELALP